MLSSRHRALIAVIAAVVASDARAQPVERIAMSYVVPEGCPSEAEFAERLRARAPVVQIERGAQRTFDVGIERVATGLRGTLVIRTSAGALVREVDGETCDETVAALVVVAALAIEASVSEPAPPPVPVEAPPPVRPPPSVRVTQRERWLAAGSGLARYQGLAPEAMFGVPVFASFGRARGPRIRVAFARTQESTAVVAEGRSTFRWTAGRIDVSPLRLVRGRFVVSPALGIAAGVLDGRGTDVGMPGGGARPWVAPEVALALGVRMGRFALELEGLASVPLVRDRFFIAPATTVHQTPWLTSAIALTLAVDVL